MKSKAIEQDFYLEDINPIDFYGANNANLNLIKDAYPDVRFVARGNSIKTLGDPEKLEIVLRVLHGIVNDIRIRGPITPNRLLTLLRVGADDPTPISHQDNDVLIHGVSGNVIRAKTPGQQQIVDLSEKNDMVFAIGPAGSGKSYTAVAIAARALKNKQVRKIVLCRPAVEAGERLGFLPGDLKEKIDPYLRPLYDALEDMIHAEKLKFFMEKNIIEIVPLAFMRGRTLNNAFIILDEAQNATEVQLKMFLTRMGNGSKAIVTGDVTQIDLPRTQRSGLIQCTKILKGIEGIGFVHLDERDVVRHPLIKSILKAYDKAETAEKERREARKLEQQIADETGL